MSPSFDQSSLHWFKSSYSEPTTSCVETAFQTGHTYVRDSKLGAAGPVLVFTADEWAAFTAGVRAGEFDGPAEG